MTKKADHISMRRESFIRLLAQRLYPLLRNDGFRGSGSTLRRINGPVLHIFNVQGSSDGISFYINLGATLTTLEMHGLTEATVAAPKEYQCVFSERVHHPARPRMSWPYPKDETDADATLQELVTQYAEFAVPWFDKYSTWPSSFASLIESESATPQHPARLLIWSRIAMLLNNHQRAEDFARLGISLCPSTATILHRDLEQILANAGGARHGFDA